MAIRHLTAGDVELLRAATLANMNWCGERFTPADVDASPALSRYVTRFSPERDLGLADDDGGTVRAVAWLVSLPADDSGYGFVAEDIPELSITTLEGWRGQGIGAALLAELLARARDRGLRGVSLSVEDGNDARRLYARAGFRVVGRSGDSDTMLRLLVPAPAGRTGGVRPATTVVG